MSETGAATTEAAKAAAVVKSPILTRLEKVIFDHLVETGQNVMEGLATDETLDTILINAALLELRQDRIQEKLETNATWLKKQFAKLKAGMPKVKEGV